MFFSMCDSDSFVEWLCSFVRGVCVEKVLTICGKSLAFASAMNSGHVYGLLATRFIRQIVRFSAV